MRKLLYLIALAAVVGFGCQPKVLILNVQPSSVVNGPAKVKIHWKLSAGKGYLSADQPVKPSLDPKKGVGTQGEMEVEVCATTTFKLEPYYGGERTTKVTVKNPCGSGGGGTCGNQTLTFTGVCDVPNQGPTYITQTISPNVVSGDIQDLQSDADFPIHVFKDGVEIALGANGGPISTPLPPVSAAGQYLITIPGGLGQQVCADATNPVGGGTAEAPVVHLTVFPACPKP
jgi:hypothetical protein